MKEVGDNVFSGTVNEDGYLEIKVTTAAKDSVISKIVTLVKRSQLNRSETESLVEKVAKYYTPIMMVAAAIVAFVPPLLFGQNLTDWVYKALSLLVISCPCAFLISTPVGMVGLFDRSLYEPLVATVASVTTSDVEPFFVFCIFLLVEL